MPGKTNKSYAKRLRVTKNGKVLARKPGQNHFNAKESGAKQGNRGTMQAISIPNPKTRARFLQGL